MLCTLLRTAIQGLSFPMIARLQLLVVLDKRSMHQKVTRALMLLPSKFEVSTRDLSRILATHSIPEIKR